MKRAAVKRKKANSGAKRKAPRRRTSVKAATASKTRRPNAKRKPRAKAKSVSPRRIVAKRKTVIRKSALKAGRRRPTLSPPTASELSTAVAVDLPSENDELNPAASKVERRPPARRKSPAKQPPFEIPLILLEGDEPESPSHSGPGEKFALGPETPAAHFSTHEAHLPASYGTGRLFLAARDPHWIYAYWDINAKDQFQHNARSQDRHLILRMHERELGSQPAAEIHVHPESRHWFAHVERAGEQYVADLGYYQPGRKWKSLAVSRTIRTPPDTISTDAKVEFATIPAEVPFETMLSLVDESSAPALPLAHAIEELRARRLREFPPAPPPTPWTSEQERALAEILAAGRTQRALLGSQEIMGLPVEGLPGDFSFPNQPSSFEQYTSSPLGGEEQTSRAFWLRVNAELTIHGSTEPDATVSIGGKQIALQPDGAFTFRFALPDGEYELPVVAVSAAGTDARAAELKFSRATKSLGEVGVQLQDPALKPPTAENV